MVDILLILSLTATVIMTVDRDIKKKREIKALQDRIQHLDDNSLQNHLDTTRKLRAVEEIAEQSKKDIEAIANAINVYSNTVSGSIENKVKANVDLFSEWLNGEIEE